MDASTADAYVHAIARNWQTASLSPTDKALCVFAAKLTHTPGQMSPVDLDVLRALVLSDRAISDAVQVIGYFNYINRVADGLGIEPEDFIQPWGAG